MELRWIESFVAVADCGSFQQAALKLLVSQPAVSAHIKDLERSVNATLVDRRTRPVRLTPAGEQFIRHARLILGEVQAGLRRVQGLDGAKPRGVVTIGTYPSASVGYVPHLLRLTRELHPEVEIVLEEMAGGEMEAAADEGRVDVFLRQAEPPLSRRRFGLKRLWTERFLVVAPRNHPWDVQPDQAVDPYDLVHNRLIMTGRFQPESLLSHPFWQDLGRYPEVVHHVQHPQSLLALVESGAGLGLTTELPAALFGAHDVTFRNIAHPAAQRDVFVNWSLARPLTDQSKAVIDLMLANPIPPVLGSGG